MQALRIIGLSLLAGCIAAGFVWYLWGLVENVRSVARRRPEDTLEAESEAEPEPEAPAEAESGDPASRLVEKDK